MPEMRTVNATEIVQKYLEGGPSEVFDLVRVMPDGERVKMQVRIALPRKEENIEALAAAQKSAQHYGELKEYGDIYRECQADEVLWRAVRATEQHEIEGRLQYPPLCTSPKHLRQAFNESELGALLNCLHIVKAKYGSVEGLESESAETWIARFSDPLRGPFFLSQLDSLHWPAAISLLATVCRDLCLAAGVELPSLENTSGSTPESSTSGTGSSGEPPSVSSTADPDLKVPTAKLLTKEEAEEIIRARRKS